VLDKAELGKIKSDLTHLRVPDDVMGSTWPPTL
jgi:hypothetical protein